MERKRWEHWAHRMMALSDRHTGDLGFEDKLAAHKTLGLRDEAAGALTIARQA
jgi:hypothetical protein